ncbi:MAG TPA: ThiF family adenylyltransferase [Solirubrobacteraceae bacterium]
MRRWYEENEDRLNAELAALNDGPFAFELDDDYQRRTGLILLRGTYKRPNGEALELEVVYPDSFPFLRPEVFARTITFERHHHPYRGNLCLLDASTRHWDPTWTAADLIAKQGEKLLALLDAGDEAAMRDAETPQGEPATRYFVGPPGAVVFVPEQVLAANPEYRSGIIRFAIGDPEDGAAPLRACVKSLELEKRGGAEVVAAIGDDLSRRFGRTILAGTWVRLEALPSGGKATAEALLAAARATPGYRQAQWQQGVGGRLRLTALVTREEVRQGEYEDGWLVVVEQEAGGKRDRDRSSYVAPGQRLTLADLTARIPSLAGMNAKTVALAGLGAIGGPIALELGRAQVGELRALDQDYAETGTSVRWPLGITAAAQPKVDAISDMVAAGWPFTTAKRYEQRIGYVPGPDEEPSLPEHRVVTEFLEGADLLIDATAEEGVQYLLSRLADSAGVPQVYASSTPGGWGGLVARVVPGETGCWYCLQLRLTDKTIEPPPMSPDGFSQPRGCMSPAWTGSSFDGLPVVAQAVRIAAGTLLHGRRKENAYDVFVLNQAGEDNLHIAPQWTSYALEPHPKCPYCSDADDA